MTSQREGEAPMKMEIRVPEAMELINGIGQEAAIAFATRACNSQKLSRGPGGASAPRQGVQGDGVPLRQTP